MKIKKQSEEIIYRVEDKEYDLLVGDKQVTVTVSYRDDVNSMPDYDININPQDFAKLSEEEQEILGENMNDILDMKNGEEQDFE